MIVREDGTSLLLITQPDHASLAATLMRAWRADGVGERATHAAALFATEHHDIGWTEFDEAPSADPATGRPFDFIGAPVGMRQAVWPRALERLPRHSTYAAALVAQHALTIYRRFRGDPAWRTFFADIERERDRWFTTDIRPDGTSGGPIDPALPARRHFLQDYAVVRTGDLMSLVFCNQWTTPEWAEGYSVQLRDSSLIVAPDPFAGARIPFRVRARRLPNRRYVTDEDLRESWRLAPEEFIDGVACGAPTAAP